MSYFPYTYFIGKNTGKERRIVAFGRLAVVTGHGKEKRKAIVDIAFTSILHYTVYVKFVNYSYITISKAPYSPSAY